MSGSELTVMPTLHGHCLLNGPKWPRHLFQSESTVAVLFFKHDYDELWAALVAAHGRF